MLPTFDSFHFKITLTVHAMYCKSYFEVRILDQGTIPKQMWPEPKVSNSLVKLFN